MYLASVERPSATVAGRTRRIAGNVLALGAVSLVTDVSSEMVSAVLPLYLVFSLGASPLALGAVDGLYRGAGAIVQIGGGFLSDRLQRYKEVASVGYGISPSSTGVAKDTQKYAAKASGLKPVYLNTALDFGSTDIGPVVLGSLGWAGSGCDVRANR